MTANIYYPIIVSLTPDDVRHYYNVHEPLPTHDLVIRMLLNNCEEAYVYGLKKTDDLFKNNSEIFHVDRGKFKFDTSKESLKGHEYLWNVTGWKRGSIVIILKDNKIDFTGLFKNCFRAGLCSTPNSGNSLSAIKKCKEAATNGDIGFCFPASNGVEWMQIYAKPDLTRQILQLALKYCQENNEHLKK